MLVYWIDRDPHSQARIINDCFMAGAGSPEQVLLQNRMKVLFPAAETSTLDRLFVENIQRAAQKNDLEVTSCEFDSINDSEKKKNHIISTLHTYEARNEENDAMKKCAKISSFLAS